MRDGLGKMNPVVGKIAFNLGITMLILAIIPLFVISPSSAEFYVDMMALIFIAIFLLIVIWDVRRQAKMERVREV